MVFDEPSMLYQDLQEHEDDDDDDADYDVSSASDNDNDMGSREQIDDLVESCTIRLLDWNDAMTDLQSEMRDPCLKHYPRSPSITPDGLFVQEGMIELKSRDHIITLYNPRASIYIVKSLVWLDGSGNNVYTLKMNEKSCSCGKWQGYTLSCSYALTVFKDKGTRPDAYVQDIYSQETYK
ncbi:hypothetical protein M9H77_03714 [Catharanthus roseus]|uniref:Uncharacterized protein n=1 Tax=Catharanthus roseus TaxID=4058 RepID=A0ACC0CC42_CATRO|nr:hypothetical protein M9H77_03714 [Catharanthus roseus]